MESSIVTWLYDIGLTPILLLQLFISLFVAILFTQSGLDKIINWSGEKEFYHAHFSKSILRDSISLIMPVLTAFELLAGFLSGLGLIFLLITGKNHIAALGMILAALSTCMLFFGQRVAKDYEGSAVLVPYFLVTMAGLYLYLML